MNITDIPSDKALHDFVKGIVLSKEFLRLKDAFVSHTPGGEKESLNGDTAAIQVAHGKVLGTRYVFNQLETIARQQPPAKRDFVRKDRDLEE